MEVLGDVYRAGVADGQRIANLELLEQISGPELMHLGRTLRQSIHEALEDAAGAMESLWNDHPAQFARVGTGLGPGLWEVREVSTSPAELTDFSEDEDDGAMTLKLVKPPVTRDLPRLGSMSRDPEPRKLPGPVFESESDGDPSWKQGRACKLGHVTGKALGEIPDDVT